MKLLRDISKEMGVTVICSLHQVDLALEFADRIIGLSKGRKVLDDAPEKINEKKIKKIYGDREQDLYSDSSKRN